MNIKINDTYSITTDALNVCLCKKRVIEKGENQGQEALDTIGYYSDFEQAYKACLKHGIQTSELTDIQEIINCLTVLFRDIESAIKNNH